MQIGIAKIISSKNIEVKQLPTISKASYDQKQATNDDY